VSAWDPTLNVDVVSDATPPTSVEVPRGVAPSKNVTVPVGVPAPGVTTAIVAVRVLACPNTDGSGVEVSVAVVEAWFTVWVSTGEVEPVKPASPLYTAVSACDPTLNDDVVNDAAPPASVEVPRGVAPSKKLTVPVGVPAPGVTTAIVAVRVLACPKTDGSGLEVKVAVAEAWFTVWVSTRDVELVKLVSPL
jgi:hypothetical protein